MQIAFYVNEKDAVPKNTEVSWETLAATLGYRGAWKGPCTVENCRGYKCPNKRNGPSSPGAHPTFTAWSPVSMIEGKTRASQNVRAVTALVLDIDDGPPLGEIEAKLAGWKYIAHSTHADRSTAGGKVHLRVVVAIDGEVPAENWRAYRQQAIALLGIASDQGGRDPAMLFYLPSHPEGYDPVYATGDGKSLPAVLT